MVMSPFQRLEAAVQALESKEKGAPELLASSTDLKTSKRLWDTTVTYLADESPCPNAAGALAPDDKPPPPGNFLALGKLLISVKVVLLFQHLGTSTSTLRQRREVLESPLKRKQYREERVQRTVLLLSVGASLRPPLQSATNVKWRRDFSR